MATRPAKSMVRRPEVHFVIDAYHPNAVSHSPIPTYTVMPNYGMWRYAWKFFRLFQKLRIESDVSCPVIAAFPLGIHLPQEKFPDLDL